MTLRRALRARRRALPALVRRRAGEALARRIQASARFHRSRRIAVYWPGDGEIDVLPLARAAWRAGKQVYLPVLARQRLRFARFTPNTRLTRNRYGIPEPCDRSRALAPSGLDLVLTPLVAFDADGHRIGMGGGYYDRSFAFLRGRPARRPWMIGVAFECQRVDQITPAEWDVPLAAVATERRWYSG